MVPSFRLMMDCLAGSELKKESAYEILRQVNAPDHLVTHVTLVGEAADALIKGLQSLNVPVDADFIRAGVVLHDIGKVIHLDELVAAGSEHEPAGQKMLLQRGVDASLARVCVSHAQWSSMECSLEELVIALADKLWKGKRVEDLELQVVDSCAAQISADRWQLFAELDAVFESIAALGDERLMRSVE